MVNLQSKQAMPNHVRRSFFTVSSVLGASMLVSACTTNRPAENLSEENKALRHKFRGIYGGVIRIDAVGYLKEYVTISNERGYRIDGSGTLSPGNVKFSTSMGGAVVSAPIAIRAIWRKGPVTYDPTGVGWAGGTILGDYTVPVAARIPDELLDSIRESGGALRLKIRLHDEGIYIGWDVEMDLPIRNLPLEYKGSKTYIAYRMAGGDFREPKISNGEIIRHAWYIDKQGNKIFTDENPHAKNEDPTRPVRAISGVHE